MRSDLEKTRFLLTLKTVADNINLTNENNYTALIYSIMSIYEKREDMIATVKTLLEAKANPNIVTNEGYTPLTAAIVIPCRNPFIPLLLQFGADINLQNKVNGNTGLMRSAFRGIFQTARLLITSGADLTKRNKDNETFIDIINSPRFGEGFENVPADKVEETKVEFYKLRDELSQQQRPKSPLTSLLCSSALWSNKTEVKESELIQKVGLQNAQ